jgi:hypothetical protein
VREPVNKNTKTSTSGGVTKVELGNLLENFKTDLLGTIGSQLDTLKIKRKQEEENPVLSIFCPKCRKRHPLRECPLDNVLYVQYVLKIIKQKIVHPYLDCKQYLREGKLQGLHLHLRGLGNLEIQM